MKINTFRARRRFLIYALSLGVFAFVGFYASLNKPAMAVAGINPQLNFQGRLLNAQGATVPDGYYNVQFKIYQDGDGQSVGNTTGSPAGSLKWTENRLNANSNGVQVRNGFMSVDLGSVTAFGSSIDWNQSVLWLSMNIGSTNGSCTPFSNCSPDGEMVPMKRLSSTPYSLNSGQLGGLTSAQFLQLAQGVQTDVSNNTSSIFINKTGTAGNFLQLQSSGNDVFTLSSTGDISFGANANHTMSIATSAASTAGRTMTISAGTAGTGASALAGGNLVLQGGTGGGTNGNGGNVNIDAGAANGSGVAGTINIGTTNASGINLNQNTTVAAGKSLTLAGGVYGTRPASPTPGMLYYDTTSNQLLQYNGTKWVSDRSTATKIVAASNSSQAVKDSADYVADGTGDQTEINSALTAAAGGKVYLAEGTYTINASISVPNNTTLAGAGAGTIITIPNSHNADINAITNTTTGGSGTGIAIQDIRIEGNKTNQTSGTMRGIYFNGAGSGNGGSAIQGGKISNAWLNNWRNDGIYLSSSSNNIITGNYGVGNTGHNIWMSGSNNTITNNLTQGSGGAGIYLSSGTYNTISGNTSQGNGYGIYLNVSTNNTVSSNTMHSNSTTGISLVSSSNNNTISGNKYTDNGGATNNNSVYLDASDGNSITENNIVDFSSTTNYAINISNGTSDKNYLANNRFSSNAADSTINDAGTGTVYSNQPRAEGGGQLTNRTANDTRAFAVQTTAGADVFAVDTTNSKVLVAGALDTTTATTLSIGTSSATSIVVGNAAGTAGLNLSSSNVTLGSVSAATVIQAATQSAANTAGNALTLAGSTGEGSGNGGVVTIQGGNSGASGLYGGSLTLSGGTGTAANGTVILATSTFQTATTDSGCFPGGTESTTTTNCTISQNSINNNASVIVGFTNDGQTALMPDPSILTAGRVVYVTASNGSKDFTLSVNGGGQGNQISMRRNTTATMIWNGADWTAAGASSSTTMQAAYDNTLQSAGGAELVVSKTSATNGLTIRDSATNSVNGALLTVQSSSAANLFSVNSNVTEYTTDSGAEVAGASASTFPAATWSAVGATTISRYNTAGNYIATGQGSVSVVTPATANTGVKNQLASALTANTTYNVSFASRIASGTFTDMNVYYSTDGSAASVACTTSASAVTSVWQKINCIFTTPTSGISTSNAILIRQTGGSARTFYVDNASVTIAADYNFATDGSVNDSTNFATNWSTAGLGTVSVTRNTSDGYDASDSATAIITSGAANAGMRNKLSSSPLSNTLYRVTTYVKLSSGSFTDFKIRYSPDGGTNYVDCVDYSTQTISTTSWTKVTCYITTTATATTNPYVYFVETASATRTFHVDNFSMTLSAASTPNIQVGGGVNGGPTTLFTLDKGASAPIASDNDALLGSMYYDTTLGKLQCYEADGWGACGSSPDNIVTISPEYTNAVLHGTGIGTMTSDICSDTLNINDGSSGQSTICGSNETYNFYKWTSPQASAQTYGIYVTYQLPSTFKSFTSGQTSLMGRTDSANATANYQVYRNDPTSGLTACGSSVSVSTGLQSSWQVGYASGAADPSTCGFAPGDSIVFKISITASQNANTYVGNLNFSFSNR